ncbi:MAG TPA: hypothetical protein VG106_15600, partial [Vicinamibacterales bacterium]|nr:hypothetical protein [Vicinamibacterales bacterium]
MPATWTAAAAMALSLVCAPVCAQGLVDAAKRAEESRKANATQPFTFDERDVNPLLAAREILSFQIDEKRWPAYVTADHRVMDVMEKDLALYGRLELLRATNARMIERFLLREPSLVKALKASGMTPHDYAYTSLALGVALAFVANDPGPQVMEQLPEATKANLAFVRAHDEEIKKLLVRGQQIKARAERLAARKDASAGATKSADAAAKAATGDADKGSRAPDKAAPRLSRYAVDEPRWRRFLAADKLVMEAVEKEPRLFAELRKLNLFDDDPDESVVSIERLIATEPALSAAVKAAGSDPREYAYTQMAITVAATLAFADPPPPPGIIENAPAAVKANLAFV